jgi:SPP1 gp7 family putative phage head morphogenesis protein
MPTLNEELLDQTITREVFLQRYGNGLANKVLRLLAKQERAIEAKLAKGGAITTKRILEQRLVEIRKIIRLTTPQIETLMHRELHNLALTEADYAASGIKNGIKKHGGATVASGMPQPNLAAIATATTAQPFQGRLLKEWMREFEGATARGIRNAIRIGFVEGETLDQITERVKGIKRNRFRGSTFKKARDNSEAIVRTAINHYSNFARQKAFEGMGDALSGMQWRSTLDGRTTPICQARDGEVYPVNSGPRPPAHINCRSGMTPVVKSAEQLGLRKNATRASMDGQIPADLSYNDFLKGKVKSDFKFVEDLLGKKKARLFRDGGLDVQNFVNPRGQVYTLKELKRDYTSAWKKAGLN